MFNGYGRWIWSLGVVVFCASSAACGGAASEDEPSGVSASPLDAVSTVYVGSVCTVIENSRECDVKNDAATVTRASSSASTPSTSVEFSFSARGGYVCAIAADLVRSAQSGRWVGEAMPGSRCTKNGRPLAIQEGGVSLTFDRESADFLVFLVGGTMLGSSTLHRH